MKDIISKHAVIYPELISDDLRNESKKICSAESVALHVRRTDYLNPCNVGFTNLTINTRGNYETELLPARN